MPTHMIETAGPVRLFIDGMPVGEFENVDVTWTPEEPDITGETRPPFLTAMNPAMEITGTITMSARAMKALRDSIVLGWRAKGHPRRKMLVRARRLRKRAVIF